VKLLGKALLHVGLVGVHMPIYDKLTV